MMQASSHAAIGGEGLQGTSGCCVAVGKVSVLWPDNMAQHIVEMQSLNDNDGGI